MKPIRYDDLVQATLENDSDARYYGYEAALLEAGLDSEEAKRWVDQRGIRGALVATYAHAELEKLRGAKKPYKLKLTDKQKEAKRLVELGLADGLAVGARAARLSEDDGMRIIRALQNELPHHGWDEEERTHIEELLGRLTNE